MAQSFTAHPLAKLFPDMPDADFAALVEDVRQNGVKIPILIYRGRILDGRQRYRACQKLNVACPTVIWNGRDLGEALDAGDLAIEGDRRAVTRFLGLFPHPRAAA